MCEYMSRERSGADSGMQLEEDEVTIIANASHQLTINLFLATGLLILSCMYFKYMQLEICKLVV